MGVEEYISKEFMFEGRTFMVVGEDNMLDPSIICRTTGKTCLQEGKIELCKFNLKTIKKLVKIQGKT